MLGEENLEKLQKNNTPFFHHKSDVWARPQQIIFILAANQEDLIGLLENNKQQLLTYLSNSEDKAYRKHIFCIR